MDVEPSPTEQPVAGDAAAEWLHGLPLTAPRDAARHLGRILACGVPADLLDQLRQWLRDEFTRIDDVDGAVREFSRFVLASRSPTALLALFQRDPTALPSLLQILTAGPRFANQLVADPESFDLLRASDGEPAPRHFLVDELTAELRHVAVAGRAAEAIHHFVRREVLRIAYGECVRGISPDVTGQQLTSVAEAALEAALAFALRRIGEAVGFPDRLDGSTPQFAILGLGGLGGGELGYHSRLPVLVLCDQIDRANQGHVAFYEAVVTELVTLLDAGGDHPATYALDFVSHTGTPERRVRSLDEAIIDYESANRVWQRMSLIKARVVAGSVTLGQTFLQRLAARVYRARLSGTDLGEIRTLRRKLERRAARGEAPGGDVDHDPGGRRDVELTVQFLQLLHGHDLPQARCPNTLDAIIALEQAGCVTHQEAALLGENYARLSRLGHHLSMLGGGEPPEGEPSGGEPSGGEPSGGDSPGGDSSGGGEFPGGAESRLPEATALRRRLAWRLGIRDAEHHGDRERFERLLAETFRINRRIINHLMVDGVPGEPSTAETELLLDPDPDPALVRSVLQPYGLADASTALDSLVLLGAESVPFLSARRCRHFLSLLAPALLAEIGRTPEPSETLRSLVRVTDSLGAKATLWELFRTNPPTMRLMVRLCAAAPYLSGILIRHPGMIDELIDSLVIDALPSAERLDAQSIELCRAAEDIGPILQSFKNCAHLTVGVRDILGKDTIEATHQALSDTAEACLRRIIEREQETLAGRYGDPVDADGDSAELIVIGLGKFGGREPNYHSDLDVSFLYTADGHTIRRVGGPRSTTTNRDFFTQLVDRVTRRVTELGPLYELDRRLAVRGEGRSVCASLDAFLRPFRHGIAPLWQRLELCQARCITGSRDVRRKVAEALRDAVARSGWHARMAEEIRDLRLRLEANASQSNLKRGVGGTLDVEWIAQMLTLRHARRADMPRHTGTTACLRSLADAGVMPEDQALTLIGNYRILRRVEANLRLMDTPERHQFPDDPARQRQLAFLMNESDPEMIRAQCQNARRGNRKLFESLLRQAGESHPH